MQEQPSSQLKNEELRLETLKDYEILDSDHEQAFDDLAALASYICGTPISAISLVDSDRQWFKASVGLDDRETARNISFCQHTILGEDILVVPDAHQDDRFKDSPLVTSGPKIRFYAGVPLVAPNGSAIGALCVKDSKPREITPDQTEALKRLARQVVGQLELRKTNASLEQQTKMLESHTRDLNDANRYAIRASMDAKKALNSLMESEERFRAFAENASDIFLMRDLDGNILYVNQAACRALEYTESELLKMKVQQLRADDSSPDLQLPDHGATAIFEGQYTTKSGTTVTAEVKISRTEIRGEPMFFTIATDRTEQIKAIEEMRKAEERFHFVCQATNDMVWDLELFSGTAWLSPNSQKYFVQGSSDQKTLLKEWMSCIHPEDRDRVVKSFDGALNDRASSWQCEYRISLVDGDYADVLDRAFVIMDENKVPIRVIGALSDHTERKQAEQDRQDREQAERSNLAKSQFLSRMSHELRTPLNAILGFAQLLEMYQPTDQQKECIARILTGGKHLLGLINEVLDLSRIESGNMEISLEPVRIMHVVDEAINLTQSLAKNKSVTVSRDPKADVDLYAMADRQRLLQIAINLISNGVKYNREGGTVVIGIDAPSKGSTRLVVTDTGLGISKDLAHRVFMPFDRLGIEQSNKIEGTGLGLALSKNIAEAMWGTLSFTSEVGVGSVFSVELSQAAQPQIEATQLEAIPAMAAGPRHKRVLYIEDNESNVALMKTLFSARPEWELEIRMSGRDGFEATQRSIPDLLLLDLDLPDISGFEVLTKLRNLETTAHLPVLIVSADATRDRIDRLTAAGANGYVTKPFDVQDLLLQITSQLSGDSQRAA